MEVKNNIFLILALIGAALLTYFLLLKQHQDDEGLLSHLTLEVSKTVLSEENLELEFLITNSSNHDIHIRAGGKTIEKAIVGSLSINGKNVNMSNYKLPAVIRANSSEAFTYSHSPLKVSKSGYSINVSIGIMSWKMDGGKWKERGEGWILKSSVTHR